MKFTSAQRRVIGGITGVPMVMLALGSVEAFAQTAPPTTAVPVAQSVVAAEPAWQALGKADKVALAPLEKSWDKLGDGHKRKWLAIAKTYPSLTPAEQEKMHSRMADWAALSPKDREVARLNYAQTKAVTPSDRAANWEAYQALSPREREKLAQDSKVKPVGAAVAARPVASDKLIAVPVTRHTPESERSAAVSAPALNRSTLLPQKPAPVSSAPVIPVAATPVKP